MGDECVGCDRLRASCRGAGRARGATSTTEVFVLDRARTLVYRGAIDDQYGLGYGLDAPRRHFLVNALEAALADERPLIAATSAPGCAISPPVKAVAAERVTYHN